MSKLAQRQKIRYRIRKKVTGTSAKPRLSVFRSNADIYCQLIDDVNGDPELLKMLIEDATEEPHSFLTIKLNSGKPIFYKKFNKYLL